MSTEPVSTLHFEKKIKKRPTKKPFLVIFIKITNFNVDALNSLFTIMCISSSPAPNIPLQKPISCLFSFFVAALYCVTNSSLQFQ